MSKPYPKEVSMLSAKDLIKGDVGENGHSCPHCLAGWVEVEFGSGSTTNKVTDDCMNRMRQFPRLRQSLDLAIDETEHDTRIISSFNDAVDVPLSLLARVWNRAMYLLGYTEGNKESKPLKRRFT